MRGPRADERESIRTHDVNGYTSEKSWEAIQVDGLVSDGGSVGSACVHSHSSSCRRRGPYLSEGGLCARPWIQREPRWPLLR